MTSRLPRGSEKYCSDEVDFQQHVREDLHSHDPIVLASTIVGNLARVYNKFSDTNILPNEEIVKSDDDITVMLEKLKSITARYTILSQKYLSISEKVLAKLKELSDNLSEGRTVKLYCDVEDSKSIIQLYENLNSYTREGQELLERIRLLLSDSDNMENYKDQFNEVFKSWDASKDKFKGIGEKNTDSEYYIVNEILNELSNIDAQLFYPKKDSKKGIDGFLNLIKGKLSNSEEGVKEIVSKFLDSMNSLIEVWREVLHQLRYKQHTFDLSTQYSEGNFDGKEGVYSSSLDANPKSELRSADSETTFTTNEALFTKL